MTSGEVWGEHSVFGNAATSLIIFDSKTGKGIEIYMDVTFENVSKTIYTFLS